MREQCAAQYSVKTFSYQTDGLDDYPHICAIQKMMYVCDSASGFPMVGALDVNGVVSMWSLVQVNEYNTQYDVNMNIGCNYRMALSYSENLFAYDEVLDYNMFDDLTQSVEIEFDPKDPQVFFFSTGQGLFKLDKKDLNAKPIKMNTLGLNNNTALSLCDKGYLLAAFSCGSIV